MKQHQQFGVVCCSVLWMSVVMPDIAKAATMAHWNFEQGTPGAGFHSPGGTPVPDQSGNGNTMFGFNDTFSPHYSAVGDTPTGFGLSSFHNGGQDGFTHPCCSAALNAWEPEQWTIETAFKFNVVTAFRTMIGRDGGSFAPPSDFYLQLDGTNQVRVDFATVAGPRVGISSTLVPTVGKWYRVAATSDNLIARLWIDQLDGSGWQLAGSQAIPGATATDRALAAPNPSGANWVFGRGWFNGAFVDHITGNLDDIRFSDVALSPAQFIPEPGSLSLLTAALVAIASCASRRESRGR